MVEIGFHTKYILKKMWCRNYFYSEIVREFHFTNNYKETASNALN